jgi:hypothetical protein
MSVRPKYNDRQTVKTAVYEEVKSAVGVTTNTPSEHIAVSGDSVDNAAPRVFLDASMTDTSRGLHDRRIIDIERTGTAINDIIYGKRTQLAFDCSIASKTVGGADEVANAVQTAFDSFDNRQRAEDALTDGGPPIHDVSVEDGSPQNDNQRFGEVLTVLVEYTERQAHSAIGSPPTAVTDITIDFEVGSSDLTEATTLPTDRIPAGESYTVPAGQSDRIRGPYTVEGELTVNGLFITTEELDKLGTVNGDGRILVTSNLSLGDGFRDAIVRPSEL